jgi:hypothetical protein
MISFEQQCRTFPRPVGLGPAEGVRWALVTVPGVGLLASWLPFVASRKLKAAIVS